LISTKKKEIAMNVSSITQSILYSTTSHLGVFQPTSSASSGYGGITSAGTLIAQDDAEEDEQLTINDTPLPEDMFNVADEDGDGYLTQEEFEAYLESRPGALDPSQVLAEMDAASILESEDADGSGTLAFEETTLTEEMFATADTDEDGELSEEEIEEYISSASGAAGVQGSVMDAASIIKDEDEDGDGVLSIDETTLTEEMFAAADSDGDEYISSEELEDYLSSAPEGTGGMGAPPPGGMPPEEDVEEEETSITSANAFAIQAYENVSSNFMNIMIGGSGTYTDDVLSDLVV
jgi:Ca2+-binding EF-hand superfamily protein